MSALATPAGPNQCWWARWSSVSGHRTVGCSIRHCAERVPIDIRSACDRRATDPVQPSGTRLMSLPACLPSSLAASACSCPEFGRTGAANPDSATARRGLPWRSEVVSPGTDGHNDGLPARIMCDAEDSGAACSGLPDSLIEARARVTTARRRLHPHHPVVPPPQTEEARLPSGAWNPRSAFVRGTGRYSAIISSHTFECTFCSHAEETDTVGRHLDCEMAARG